MAHHAVSATVPHPLQVASAAAATVTDTVLAHVRAVPVATRYVCVSVRVFVCLHILQASRPDDACDMVQSES